MNVRGRAVRASANLIGTVCFSSLFWIAAPTAKAATTSDRQSTVHPAAQHNSANKLLHATPLYFVPNAGQADPAARFVAHGHGYELELRQHALAVRGSVDRGKQPPAPVLLEFAGANSSAQITGASQQVAKINYLVGNDPEKWRRNLPTYRQVRYTNLYPGIDLVCYGADGGRLEYDLVVAPGADLHQIRLHVGAGHMAAIGSEGDLEVDGPHGPLALGEPVFYQNVAHGKQAILGSFVAEANGDFGFHAVSYDHTRPLVIDPPINILYSTYFGGSLDDEAAGIAIDGDGNSYVAGGTNSVDMLSTTNAYQPARGAPTAGYQVTNAFIAKFDPTGTLLYGTYLGGSDLEWAGAITVDKQGNAYVAGLSSSSDFPTTANAYAQPSGQGNQMFIAEIGPDGSTLEYSTLYGVSASAASLANSEISSSDHTVTWGNMGIALSTQNKIYVSASAFSGLPTSPTAYMPNLPGGYLGYGAFVAELDPTQIGSAQLLAATYLTAPTPSSGQNYSNTRYYGTFSYALTLDPNGNVWIGGRDQTGALPTTSNAYQKSVTLGNPSAICSTGSPVTSAPWLAELTPDLSQLSYASYLSGGTAAPGETDCNEWIQGLASGTDGSIYAVGATTSASFPTTAGVLQPSYPGASPASFVAKFTPNGASLAWSTYLGQSGGAALIDSTPFVDAQGNVWVGGMVTGSLGSNFPLSSNALDTTCGGQCAFVTGISSDGTGVVFSTPIGASYYPTFATGVDLDSAGNVHIAGTTTSTAFPLSSNAAQTQLDAGLNSGDEADWFFTILGSGTVSVTGAYVGGNDGDDTITITGSGYQQGATCSLVSGGTTIASTQAAVSSDGTQIACTFPLEGATLGTYNIVITEPDGSTTTKQNDFTVEQAQGPNVWVNLTGRSHLRSSLPSTMTVTYGNSGDTDALGVPIFVTIPSGVTVTVLTTLLNAPNTSTLNMSTVPQTVTVGSNTVLPLFIPRIAAGTSGSVQIQVTPPSTDTDITLAAYNWPPLATSASDLESALGIYQNGNLTPLERLGDNFTPKWRIILDPEAGAKCVQDVTLLALSLAVQASPISKDIECASSMTSFLGSAATTLINASLSSNYSSSDAAADLGQLYAGGADAALSCVSAAAGNTPAGMSVSVIAFLLNNAIQISGTLSDCSSVATINNNQNKNSSVGGAIDPNDKSGPTGDGSASQYIRASQALSYNLAFENQPTATLPAAKVVITDQLDPTKLNLSTFSLGLISFGANTISVPSGTTSFSTLYSLNSSLSVQINASLDASTGLATWTLQSIDPSTGLPPTDPTVGFLPPDADGIVGQGSVLFNAMPVSTLTTGTQITNTASVVFDSNSAINTPTWLNTMDVDTPVSSVTALPSTEVSTAGAATFNVSWSGTDKGSGIANYAIYVSDNGGAFTPWQIQTTAASAAFTGTVGHTYGFYSIATDAAGNNEAVKTAAEATTQVVVTPTTTVLTSSSPSANLNASVTFTATVAPTSGSGVPTGTVTFFDGSTQLGAGTLSAGVATYSTSSLTAGAHSITAQYGGDTDDAPSTSSTLTQTVIAPSFSIGATPTSLTVTQGSSGTTTITVTPVGGFNQQVSFACSGLPAYTTCAFSPSTLTPSGSPASTTLTIATDIKTAEWRVVNPSGSSSAPRAVLAILGFGLLAFARKRGRGRMTAGWFSSVIIAILFSIPLLVCGCGGGSPNKTSTGTFQITVSASAGSLSQTATIAVIVE